MENSQGRKVVKVEFQLKLNLFRWPSFLQSSLLLFNFSVFFSHLAPDSHPYPLHQLLSVDLHAFPGMRKRNRMPSNPWMSTEVPYTDLERGMTSSRHTSLWWSVFDVCSSWVCPPERRKEMMESPRMTGCFRKGLSRNSLLKLHISKNITCGLPLRSGVGQHCSRIELIWLILPCL